MKLSILGTNVEFFLNRWNHIFLEINARFFRDNLEVCRISHGSVSHAGAVLLNPDWPGGLTQDSADQGAGPVRVCQKTSQCNDPIKPDGSTHDLGDPGENRPRPIVFFSFFKCGIWNPLVYKLYVSKKNIMFFQCGIKNVFGLNTSI